MANGINRVTLLGNMGNAAEIRHTAVGTMVAQFSLATPERVRKGEQWEDATEWHNCKAFGNVAKIIQDYTGKGSRLHLEGKLQTQSWIDKQTGDKRYKTEILVSDVILISDGRGERTAAPAASVAGATPEQQFQDAYAGQGITDEDIPF